MINKILYPVFAITFIALYFYSYQTGVLLRFNANIIMNNLLIFGSLYAGIIFYLIQDTLNSKLVVKLQPFMDSFFSIKYFILIYFLFSLVVSAKFVDFYSFSYFNDFVSGYFDQTYYVLRQLIFLGLVMGSLFYIKHKQSVDTMFNYLLMFVLSFAFIIYAYDMLAFVQDLSIQYFWQSTIWVFYLFVSLLIFFLAVISITNVFNKENYKTEFTHRISTFLFGLNIFWAYLFFSQYIIIYYGNSPNEVLIMNIRFNQPWLLYQELVFILHLAIPFIFLFTKNSKISTNSILISSYAIIMATILDIFCYMLPIYSKEGIAIYEYTFFIITFLFFILLYLSALQKKFKSL